jgi:predicted RNA polymerase sigma factor
VIRDLIECVTDPTTQEAIEAVWRLESTRLIAGLVRMVRDVGLAEDLAQDALGCCIDAMAQNWRPGQSRRLVDEDRQAPGS